MSRWILLYPLLKRSLQLLLILLPIASFVVSIHEIFVRTDLYQWDLRVYYNGPIEYAQGLNPYKLSHFVYLPVFLPLFRLLFLSFTYEQTYVIFLAAKIICFFSLLVLWKKYFLQTIPL